jgi:SH3 domain-containing YSC84-like protein 1
LGAASKNSNFMEETKMKKWTIAMAGVLALSTLAVARPASEKEEKERVANAGRVVKEILDVPDNIPQDVLDKARCVVVLPSVVKAAFVVGGSYGRGVMVCRRGHDYAGPWGAPVMMALEGGSVGFQIGGEATDFVILVMNDRGMSSMLHSKVKLGGDASIAAGPKGRTASAESDVTLRAEMLSYSRSRGAFAGVSLEGSTLRPDGGANEKLYGKGVTAAEIVEEGKREGPEEGRLLVSRLQQASPHLQK